MCIDHKDDHNSTKHFNPITNLFRRQISFSAISPGSPKVSLRYVSTSVLQTLINIHFTHIIVQIGHCLSLTVIYNCGICDFQIIVRSIWLYFGKLLEDLCKNYLVLACTDRSY